MLEIAPLDPLDSCIIDHNFLLIDQVITVIHCFLISFVRHDQVVAEHDAEFTHCNRFLSTEFFEGHSDDGIGF